MRGVNVVTLIGNLGGDPEVKYTQGGMAVASISLATTSVRKDRDGQQVEKTEWHRVKLFGKLGEIAGEYLKKGRQVYIQGSIRYGEYTKDNVTHHTVEIVADEMQMLGDGGSRGGERTERNERSSNSGGNRNQNGSNRAQNAGGNHGGGHGNQTSHSHPADFGDTGYADGDIPF